MSSMVKAGTPAMRKLVRQFRPGFRLVAAGSAKFQVEAPDGTRVRSPRSNVPLTLANSPLPTETHRYERALRQAGVLTGE